MIIVNIVNKSFVADNMGVLKLTDFGFAKETHTRDTLQTPCYTPYYVGKCKKPIKFLLCQRVSKF